MENEAQLALSRLRQGRLLVILQKARIARLSAQGLPTAQSTTLLEEMERTVAGFERYMSLHGWPDD